jgi:dihydroxyacetone kinase DhaKLM complex PTS-EIIA-like component DhaM
MATETSAQRSARINAAQKAEKQRLKARQNRAGNIFEGTFTTTAQAKKNKQFDNLQKTINIAAASKNPKAGPKTKKETFSFRNQAAEALSNKKTNAEPKSKQSTKKDFGKSLKQFDTSDIKSGKEKLSTSKATAATLKDLGLKSTAKKESNKQLSDKERRQQNRAANLALRTGKTLDEASALKEKRRTDRKQYLRNFASQLARGEQAAPSKGFGEGEEGKPTTASSLVGVQKEIDAKKQQADQDQKSIYANVNTFTAPNQDLGNYSDFGKNLMQQMEMPDLSPVKYMQQEYRKKRGY